MAIMVNLDVMMAKRKMSLGELAQKVDITKAICKALDCQPGDILEFVPDEEDAV